MCRKDEGGESGLKTAKGWLRLSGSWRLVLGRVVDPSAI